MKHLITILLLFVVVSHIFSQSEQKVKLEFKGDYSLIHLYEYDTLKVKKGITPKIILSIGKYKNVYFVDVVKNYLVVEYQNKLYLAISSDFRPNPRINSVRDSLQRIENAVMDSLQIIALEDFYKNLYLREDLTVINENGTYTGGFYTNIITGKEKYFWKDGECKVLALGDDDNVFIEIEGNVYKTKEMYIRSEFIARVDSLYDKMLSEAEERVKQEKYSSNLKKYGKKGADSIKNGEVYIGMTQDMCRASWGNPSDINRTVSQYGAREQWVYGNRNYLYFENGKLTSIQTSR